MKPFDDVAEKLPVFGIYDVVVAGGGMAGMGAALAAARRGARTLIIERVEQLGGLGSSGAVGNFSYGESWKGVSLGKVFDDILGGLHKLKAIGEENGWRAHENGFFHNQTFNHAVLPWVLQELVDGAEVDVLYATDVVGAQVKDGRVVRAVIHNRSLLQTVSAHIFVDSTGDGVFARHAGAKILELDDPGHPELIKPSYMVFLHRTGREPELPVFPGYEAYGDGEPSAFSLWPEPDRMGLKLKLFHRTYDTGDGKGYSDAIAAFRKEATRAMRAFRESGKKAEWERRMGGKLGFEFLAPMLGLRESRRVEGDYVLNGADVRAGRRFDDAVAFATSCLDSHCSKEKVPPFQIPYRSLIVKGLENMFAIGRCFSGDRLALSSTRVMATGCLMGQAVGFAAARALEQECAIRNVEPAAIRSDIMKGASHRDYLEERLG